MGGHCWIGPRLQLPWVSQVAVTECMTDVVVMDLSLVAVRVSAGPSQSMLLPLWNLAQMPPSPLVPRQ
eukprot:2727563-Alexandrium_andersonii.AAC.1